MSEKSLEGWAPEIGPELTIEQVIDYAFDYRGNTTLVFADGEERTAYVSNRDPAAPEPFIQVFDEAGEGPLSRGHGQAVARMFRRNGAVR